MDTLVTNLLPVELRYREPRILDVVYLDKADVCVVRLSLDEHPDHLPTDNCYTEVTRQT